MPLKPSPRSHTLQATCGTLLSNEYKLHTHQRIPLSSQQPKAALKQEAQRDSLKLGSQRLPLKLGSKATAETRERNSRKSSLLLLVFSRRHSRIILEVFAEETLVAEIHDLRHLLDRIVRVAQQRLDFVDNHCRNPSAGTAAAYIFHHLREIFRRETNSVSYTHLTLPTTRDV